MPIITCTWRRVYRFVEFCFWNAIGMTSLPVGRVDFVSIFDEMLAADALAAMLRVISDTGLCGVRTSSALLSPGSDTTGSMEAGFTSASGEVLPVSLSASGWQITGDTCACGNRAGPLASLGSDDMVVIVGFRRGSGTTLLLRFICEIGRLGNGAGATSSLTSVGNSDVLFAEDCFCDCWLITGPSCGAATTANMLLSSACKVPAKECLTWGTDNRLGISGGLFNLPSLSRIDVDSFEPLGGNGGESETTELELFDSSSVTRKKWRDRGPRILPAGELEADGWESDEGHVSRMLSMSSAATSRWNITADMHCRLTPS